MFNEKPGRIPAMTVGCGSQLVEELHTLLGGLVLMFGGSSIELLGIDCVSIRSSCGSFDASCKKIWWVVLESLVSSLWYLPRFSSVGFMSLLLLSDGLK